MKNRAHILPIVALALLTLTGCPYDSDIPLSNSENSQIDPALLGIWYAKDIKTRNDTIEIKIIDFNAHEYLIAYKEIQSDGDIKMTNLRGYVTAIGDKKIMNLHELGRSNEITYYRYYLADNRLIVAYASDEFIKGDYNGQKELNNFFAKNIDRHELFEEDIIFTKKY